MGDQSDPERELKTWVRRLRRHNEELRRDILPRLGKDSAQGSLGGAMSFFLIEALVDLNNTLNDCRHAIETYFPDEKARHK
jgi:hypothetical protein